MRLSAKIHKPHTRPRFFRQPETLSGCLILLLSALLLLPQPSLAENISHLRREAAVLPNGQLAISTRFQTALPEQLEDALKQGVPLDFVLAYQLERPTFTAYRIRLAQLAGNDNTVSYRLTFHPLTNRYRVSVGTFSTEYNSLPTALRAVGAIANWPVLPEGTLSGTAASEVKVQVRLSLTTAKLPKPFQINALNSKGWDLDSGWQDLTVR